MSVHSRPLPATPTDPATVAARHDDASSLPATPDQRSTEASDRPSADPASARPRAVAPSATRHQGGTVRWYRSEPWLATMLVAFVPMLAALFVSSGAKYPLIGLSALTALTGLAILVRQGPFRPRE